MRYLSVCSGIEAATVAWHPLGWTPAAFAEIDAFPSAVLAHHYPAVPNAGDFTEITGDEFGTVDLLVGGTPCQDFSIAGLRAGMAGDRGNLTLEFLRLADRVRPRWVVWENVPGVLSIDGGRAFGAVLGGLEELGYGWAYRVLDAQYFGVPQRRRRVFVVGCAGDARRAAAVLFERASMSGHPTPRRAAGQDVARTLRGRSNASHREDSDTYIAYGISSDAIDRTGEGDGSAAQRAGLGILANASPALRARHPNAVATGSAVRRLTPRECERLQGFPDDEKSVIIRICADANFVRIISSPESATGQVSDNEPAAVHALIDLERGVLQLHSRNGSLLFAGSADERGSFHLPTGIVSFARLAALTMQTLEKAIRSGAVASQPSTSFSSPLKSGSVIVRLSGREIENAANAIGNLSVAMDTSHHIGSWSKFPDIRTDHDNLILLCSSCHRFIHSRGNTESVFIRR